MGPRRIGVRAIVIKDNKLLAVKHRRKDGTEAEYWAIPGGGLDTGEGIVKGVSREMIEETGVAPEIGNLLFIQQFSSTRDDSTEELEFFFHVTNVDDYANVDLSATSHGIDEIARIEFIDPRTDLLLPRFIKDIPLDAFDSSTQPVYIADYL